MTDPSAVLAIRNWRPSRLTVRLVAALCVITGIIGWLLTPFVIADGASWIGIADYVAGAILMTLGVTVWVLESILTGEHK